MYEQYFDLKETPFNLSPEPKYLYLSHRHREALDALEYGVLRRKGFIVITGDIGTGKTTLCRSLLSRLDESVETALIFNSFLSDMELLETICQELKLSMDGHPPTRKHYIDVLNDFLLQSYTAGKNVVLVIDEAQHLTYDVLEQIRMISNLETDREKLIQIILIGQPELEGILSLPSMRQLNERITVRYRLSNLGPKEIMEYIVFRLSIAGRGRISFSAGACRTIYTYSRGNPRRINAICDRALLIAYAKYTYEVTGKIIREAVKDIGHAYFTDENGRPLKKKPWLILSKSS